MLSRAKELSVVTALRRDIATFDLNLLVNLACLGIFVVELLNARHDASSTSLLIAGLSLIGFFMSTLAGLLSRKISFDRLLITEKRRPASSAFSKGEVALLKRLAKRPVRIYMHGDGLVSSRSLPTQTTIEDMHALARDRIVVIDEVRRVVRLSR